MTSSSTIALGVPAVWLGVIRSPSATLQALAHRPAPSTAAGTVAAAGVAWACLSLALHWGGHAPSIVLVPIERSQYYLWQAVFVTPLLLGLWVILSWVVSSVGRRVGGGGSLRSSLSACGPAYAVPLVLLLLVPDAILYAAFGFQALAAAIRWVAPLSALGTLALVTVAARAVHGLSTGRALLVALLGLLAQAAVGGVLLK